MAKEAEENRVFEARFSVSGILFLVALCICFCWLGLVLIGFVDPGWRVREPSLFTALLGIVCILFFGPYTLWYYRLLFKFGVAVRLDNKGLLDRHVSDETIPWDSIAWFEVNAFEHPINFPVTLWKQRYITYRIDPEYERSMGRLDRLAYRLNSLLSGRSSRLPHTTLDCSFKTLAKALREVPPARLRINSSL